MSSLAATPAGAAKRALRSVAQRWLALNEEARELSAEVKTLLDAVAAPMLERHGVGYETTGTLLCAAGDNPERLCLLGTRHRAPAATGRRAGSRRAMQCSC